MPCRSATNKAARPLLMPRIVVTDSTFPNLDEERKVATRHGAVLEEARCAGAADVLAAATGTNVLLVQFAQVTDEAIARLAPNAAIVRYGLGLDNIDVEAARKRGVRVAYVPDYATGEVADHTAALSLAALRKIVQLDRSVREGRWDPMGVSRPMLGFTHSVVGFVGFGRIGREVHARLRAFGFSAIVSDPYADEPALLSLQARAVDLDTLFATADLITLHAPLTPATKHLVNAERLNLVKPTAVIVNTARGALIDTAALEDALVEQRIGGAALDVFEDEPLPQHSRLRQMANVILTPHVAWYSAQSALRVQALAADEVERHLSGRPARCPAPGPN
jgi:D-3-phosphoglycerate dehydrogenase / 2-oxoglutarate reductase